MGGSIIDQVKIRLPYELRLLIYCYTFFVDLEPFKRLDRWREYANKHAIPSRAAFLQNKAYIRSRQRGFTDWPEGTEEALFKAIDWTHPERNASITRKEDMLISGSEAVHLLQTGNMSLRHPFIRHEVIADIILALTGRRVQRAQVAARINILQDYARRFLQVPYDRSCDIIHAIAALGGVKPSMLVHDALHQLLHDDILMIGDDIQGLGLCMKTFSPGLRSSIKRILLFYDPIVFAQSLELIRAQGSLSTLETVYIHLQREEEIALTSSSSPTRDAPYKTVQKIMEFKLSVQSINNCISVVLLQNSAPSRVTAGGKRSDAITINATEYFSIDTSAMNTWTLGLLIDRQRFVQSTRASGS